MLSKKNTKSLSQWSPFRHLGKDQADVLHVFHLQPPCVTQANSIPGTSWYVGLRLPKTSET